MFWPMGALASAGPAFFKSYQGAEEYDYNKQLRQMDLLGQQALGSAFSDPTYQGYYQGAAGGPRMGADPGRSRGGTDLSSLNTSDWLQPLSQPSLEGPSRGSPAGGLPVQAREASSLGLGRERVQAELDNNPALQQQFDALTKAEVGNDPGRRQRFQELTINSAVANNKSLADTIARRDYYPPDTFARAAREGGSGVGVSEGMFDLRDPSNLTNFATGNASLDPKTGRYVGFQGGPQTGFYHGEQSGIEGPNLPWARAMGYQGPSATGLGPYGPQGPQDVGGAPGDPMAVARGGAPGGPGGAMAQRGGTDISSAGRGVPQGGGPQGIMDLPTLAQRIRQTSPNLPPMAMFAALNRAIPLLNVEGKMQLAQLRNEMQEKMLDFKYQQLQERGEQARMQESGKMSRADLAAQLRREAETGRTERAQLSSDTRLQLGKLSNATKREIADMVEGGKDRRLEFSTAAKEELARMNIDARRELTEYLEAGREARSVRQEEGKTARAELSANTRKEVTQMTIKGRQELQEFLEGGRMQRATMSDGTRREIAQMSVEARKEIAEKMQASITARETERQKFRQQQQDDLQKHRKALEDKWGVGGIEGNKPEDRLARAGWTPDVIEQEARTFIETGREPRNLGSREIAGMVNAAVKSKAREIREKEGISLQKMTQNWQQYKAEGINLQRMQTGRQGDTIRSFDVLVHHLSIMDEVATALDNGDIKTFNALSQAWAEQTGNPAPTNFDAVKSIVGDEIVRAILGSGSGALGDRAEVKARIDRANSPEALAEAINYYRTLAVGQLNGLKNQYEHSTRRKDFETILLPTTRKALEAGRGGGAAAPAAGWGPVQRE